MCNLKYNIIPVIVRATGIVKKRFKEKFGSHSRKTFDRFTPETAVLGTAHIIWKVLQCEA
jgi:hypothetical protein